jgi:plastocyanin
MNRIDSGRRDLWQVSGAALAAAVAGCVGGDDGSGDVPSEVDNYLADANGYEGSVADRTRAGTVTVENGTNAPEYAFEPAATRVDAGTGVTWEWVEDVPPHKSVGQRSAVIVE